MALVLSRHPAWRIMITGRWKSMAFLAYIREQIHKFSEGVSKSMLLHPDFQNIPDSDDAASAIPSPPLPTGVDGITLVDGTTQRVRADSLSVQINVATLREVSA